MHNKSRFLSSAEQMKGDLGPALCLAKWKQISLHLTTGLNNSCYHPPLHQINPEEIATNPAALHNTQHKKAQRKIMLQQERPSECSYCWNMEDLGNLSDRHYRSGEPWAAVDFEKIKNSTGEEDVIPSYVEVNFNNACNLKCSYCSPQFSSSWQQEVERHGAFPTLVPHNHPEHFSGNRRPIPARDHNPYVEAFWAWWPTLYLELKHFRMTGGEPLMDRNTYRVFDYVLDHPKNDLHLAVTSNFSVEPELSTKYFDYVKRLCDTDIEHFMQYVSLDSGIGPQAEYIRHGLDFNRLTANVETYLQDIPYRNSLTFIITMNNLSVTVLRQPAWQSLQTLPESYAAKLEHARDFMLANLETKSDPFHGFKDYEVQRLERDIAWMRSPSNTSNTQHLADFSRFFSEHDRRRGTNFENTFPEMISWWKQCGLHAR